MRELLETRGVASSVGLTLAWSAIVLTVAALGYGYALTLETIWETLALDFEVLKGSL